MSIEIPRIAVGQVWQESHDFNPVRTETADFVIERGPAAYHGNLGAGSTLGGILRYLASARVDIRPILAARARPGGTLSQQTYSKIKAEVLERIRAELPLDALVFELHGAMTADGIGSTEGDLVAAIRELVGPRTVIAVGLDLHGHPSDALLQSANIVTACKEHPHRDVVQAGQRAAALALATLRRAIRPVTAVATIPLVLRGGYETHEHPLCEFHAAARSRIAESSGKLLDVSIFNIQPFLDVEGMGQAFVAISDDDAELAGRTVEVLARECWRRRDEFVDTMPDTLAALSTMVANPTVRPYVLSDYGDRVLAGAPGDSIEVLRAVMDSGMPLSCAIPVLDPETVQTAIAAGVGAKIRVAIGGRFTPGLRPLTLDVLVESISNGEFTQRGPYQKGQRTTLGATAVLRHDRHVIIVTSVSGMTQDPEAFTSQGVDLDAVDFFVSKSGNHFKLNFAGIAEPIVAKTPGLSLVEPGLLPFKHARVYPDQPISDGSPRVRVFRSETA